MPPAICIAISIRRKVSVRYIWYLFCISYYIISHLTTKYGFSSSWYNHWIFEFYKMVKSNDNLLLIKIGDFWHFLNVHQVFIRVINTNLLNPQTKPDMIDTIQIDIYFPISQTPGKTNLMSLLSLLMLWRKIS